MSSKQIHTYFLLWYLLHTTVVFLVAVSAVKNEDVFVKRVADIAPGNRSVLFTRNFVSVADHVYFVASVLPQEEGSPVEDPTNRRGGAPALLLYPQIYSIDNRDERLQVFNQTGSFLFAPDQLFALNDHQVVFTGEDDVHGRELWVVDHESRTRLVKDINSGPSSAFLPFDAYPVFSGHNTGIAYFVARTLDDNVDPEALQLYRSDGTAEGTQPVTQLDVSTQKLEFTRHVVKGLNSVFYILYNQDAKKSEIWINNAGCLLDNNAYVMHELSGELSNTFAITILPEALNGQIVLQYAEAWVTPREAFLWTIDPKTGVQTKLLGNLVEPSSFLPMYAMLGTERQIHYVTKAPIDSGDQTTEDGLAAIVVTDGSLAGTKEIRTFDPDIEGDIVGIVTLADGEVLIFQMRIVNDPTMGMTDVEAEATASMRNGGVSDMVPPPTTVMDVWKTDGTVEGTVLTMSLLEGSMIMNAHAISKDRIVLLVTKMAAKNVGLTYELWVTDGSMEGTSVVYNSPLSQTLVGEDNAFLQFFASQTFVTTSHQDRLYFTGYDVEHGVEPWVMYFELDPDDAQEMDENKADGGVSVSSGATPVSVTVGTAFLFVVAMIFVCSSN